MKTKRNLALAGLALVLGATVLVTAGAGGGGKEPFKLEGTWIATDPAAPAPAPAWVYHLAPSDPSGRQASLQARMITQDDPTAGGAFPEAEYVSGYTGTAAITGPDTAVYTIPNYAMKRVGGKPVLVYFTVDSGTIKRIAPDKLEVTHNLAIYLPFQDANGDGLPDAGQAPIARVPNILSLDTRLPILPPCQP